VRGAGTPSPAADLELAQRCGRGDLDAFEQLYRAHAGRLYTLIVRMVASAETAEDLLQEVFLTAYRKVSSFRGDSSLGTWLYRMAVNHCLDYLRGRQNKMARTTDSIEDEGMVEPVASAPLVASTINRLDLERAIAHRPRAAGRRSCPRRRGVPASRSRRCCIPKARRSRRHKARMQLRGILSGAVAVWRAVSAQAGHI
jgi:RNA polymerase sigma-70 factor (ECF subfamily)